MCRSDDLQPCRVPPLPEASCHWGTWGTCPPDSVATLVNSLQNRVKSITLCVNLNANTGKIVLVTLCIQIEWLFYAFCCETVTRKWRWLHQGTEAPLQMTGHGGTESKKNKKQESDQTVLTIRKRLPKRLIVLVKPKKWSARQKQLRREKEVCYYSTTLPTSPSFMFHFLKSS